MIFLGIFVFLIFFIAYFRKRHTRIQQDTEQAFWDREREANLTRRQDISGLPYINIPLDDFPIGSFKNNALEEYEQTLIALSEKKILNLEGQTNTDLKLAYGVANLTILSECEENFIVLCRILVSYAETLLSEGHTKEAQTVLEFGISCGSDISKNYLLLAEIYLGSHEDAAFDNLLTRAKELHSPMRLSIVAHLEELRNS